MFKQMIHIFELQASRLGEEAINDRYPEGIEDLQPLVSDLPVLIALDILTAKTIKIRQSMFSMAIGVIWTTVKTDIPVAILSQHEEACNAKSKNTRSAVQFMKPPNAWPLDLILVVQISAPKNQGIGSHPRPRKIWNKKTIAVAP